VGQGVQESTKLQGVHATIGEDAIGEDAIAQAM